MIFKAIDFKLIMSLILDKLDSLEPEELLEIARVALNKYVEILGNVKKGCGKCTNDAIITHCSFCDVDLCYRCYLTCPRCSQTKCDSCRCNCCT
jgi:hypothetical protein